MTERRHERLGIRLPATVWGMGADGEVFVEHAFTLDISPRGGRLAGLKHKFQRGDVVSVQHGVAVGRFRVVWVGPPGTSRDGQAGIACIEVGEFLPRTLVYIGSDPAQMHAIAKRLNARDYEVLEFVSVRAGLQVLGNRLVDALLLEHPITSVDPKQVISAVRRFFPEIRIVVLPVYPSMLPEPTRKLADAVLPRTAPFETLATTLEHLIGSGKRAKWPLTRVSRRYSVRTEVAIQVVREGRASEYRGYSVDLSETGMRASVSGELLPGEIISVRFVLPNLSDPIEAHGVVRRREGEIYGIEFATLTSDQQNEIRALCDVMTPVGAPHD